MSGLSGIRGQSNLPLRTPSPHAITNAGASRGSLTAATSNRSAQSQGYLRDVTRLNNHSVMPVWSDPAWDGTYLTVSDESTFWRKEIRAGDYAVGGRPALRLEDDLRNPTTYARRFGVQPRDFSRDVWGHSGLTPTDPAFQTSAQRPEDDAVDESLQTIYFGYTSAELIAQGAFDPRLLFSWPPDLDEPVDYLFDRRRWNSPAAPPPPGSWAGRWDVRYGSLLNGTPGRYDASTNQVVWDAIEPALKLASRIIKSNHPYWLAVTSVFHMRPVPEAKDGRTPEQRAEHGGAPYTSVWLDDDENNPRIPAPYPEMKRLKSLGFDSTASRTVCFDILRQYLRFFISNEEGVLGSTVSWENFNIVISISPSLIWPLLNTRFVSNAERVSHTFAIANAILHELAHACARVHRDVTCKPDLLLSTSFAPRANEAIWTSLWVLGDQIYGPATTVPPSTDYSRSFRPQPFTEDDVQGEDGLNLEKQLWGGRVAPNTTYPSSTFSQESFMVLAPWPGHHPQPWQQGRTMKDQNADAYERFLVDPRASSWSEILAIPTQWYARYFEKSWWQTSFQKFRHHGLRLTTNDPALPITLLRTNGLHAVMQDDQDVMAIIFGADAWEWLLRTALATLQSRRLWVMSCYLLALISQASAATIFETRFNNEILSWPNKTTQMAQAARGVSNDYQTMVNLITQYLQPGAPAFNLTFVGGRILDLNNSIRRVLGPMLEFSQVMGQEVAYQQYILTQYLQLSAAVRAAFYTMMQDLHARTTTNLDILSGRLADIPLQFATIIPETEGGWSDMLQQKLTRDILQDVNAPNMLGGFLPLDIETRAQTFDDLMKEIAALHRSFNTHVVLLKEMNDLIGGLTSNGRVPDSSDWPRLRSFSRIRSQRCEGAHQAAALRELAALNERALATMWQDALALVGTKLDPAVLDPAKRALQSAEDRRVARQSELLRQWQLLIRNEKARRAERANARRAGVPGMVVEADPTPQELLERMRRLAGDVEDDQRLLNGIFDVVRVRRSLESR